MARKTSDRHETLIDRIYEAAVAPEHWPAVLSLLSETADGNGAILFTARGDSLQWTSSADIYALTERYVTEGWPARTDRAQRLFTAQHPGFLNDLDVYTREELDREPVFTEFLRPNGLGWGAATAISVPNGDSIAIDIERRYERGPIGRDIIRRLDVLRPHLARATLLSAQLQLERVRSAALALDIVGLPAAVLGSTGRPLAVNRGCEALMPDVIEERMARLALTNPAADHLLFEALTQLGPDGDAHSTRSIPVPAKGPRPPMIVHLVPIRGSAHDFFSGAQAILVVTPVVAGQVPGVEVLQGLFDLTPAEARVARAIAQRQSIENIARLHGLSPETIRTQAKSVLAKTGAKRNIDLATILAGSVLVTSEKPADNV